MRNQSATFSPGVILVAEDDDMDFNLLESAFQKNKLPHRLMHVKDGQEALDYLHGEGIYCDRKRFPRPDMLLVDVNMPRLDGFEVLAALRDDPWLRDLPVVVRSGSPHLGDRAKALELGANAYYVKPFRHEELCESVRTTCDAFLGSPSMQPTVQQRFLRAG